MFQSITRRQILKASPLALPFALSASDPTGFRERAYLGWITDLDSRPDAHAPWPSMRLDPALIEDYRRTFVSMKRLGFNAIVIWGFYVSRSWPLDIPHAVPEDRGALVAQLIDVAHEHGIRVYTGLGVYSWGFEEIIRANPRLSRGNASAMCASQPESWDWMRKVIDFAMTRFPVDGVSLQSADQGRCDCDQCRRWPDTEYHTRLDIRVSEYIRSHWPGKTVGVSGWGMRFADPSSLPSLVELSKRIDYLIDVRDSARQRDPSWRRKLIRELACNFGTLGGPQVEPPQHLARDRWFLPTVRRGSEHLAELYWEGGRACEYFFHILGESRRRGFVLGRRQDAERSRDSLAPAFGRFYRGIVRHVACAGHGSVVRNLHSSRGCVPALRAISPQRDDFHRATHGRSAGSSRLHNEAVNRRSNGPSIVAICNPSQRICESWPLTYLRKRAYRRSPVVSIMR